MIISPLKILKLNKKYHLIENLDKRELQPEGAGFDLRVGEIFKIKGKGFLGKKERKTPTAQKIADIKKDKKILIKPGDYFLVKTIEKVNLPPKKILIQKNFPKVYLCCFIFPRSTLQRCGLYLRATKVDPGYFGELTFGLTNLGKANFELELGTRIANIVFLGVLGEVNFYRGQWKGGRVTTSKKEKQI